MLWIFLIAFSIEPSLKENQKNPSFFDKTLEVPQNTKVFTGYIDVSSDTFVFTHFPTGKYPHAIVYKHEIVATKSEQKIIIKNAANRQVAVRIIGNISSNENTSTITIGAIKILDLENN